MIMVFTDHTHLLFVVTSRAGADLLSLMCVVLLCFVTFSIGVLAQLWFLIVLVPDLCLPLYRFDSM